MKGNERMRNQNILLKKSDGIATIIINRPQFNNALNTQTLLELGTVVEDVKKDEDILSVIVTGAGENFSSGVELGEMECMSPDEAKAYSHMGSRIFRKLELMEKPVIAAIDGYAMGVGFQLSLACDIRISSDRARFSMPEVGHGIIPGLGGTQRLRAIVGMGRAKEIIFSGKEIPAGKALEIGLVNEVVDHGQLMDEALGTALSIVKGSSRALKLAKAAINIGAKVDMDTALGLEEELFAECFLPE